MIQIEIVDNVGVVTFNREINGKLNSLEFAKPYTVDLHGSNKMRISDDNGNQLDFLYSDVVTPDTADINELHELLISYNATAPSAGSAYALIAKSMNVNLGDPAEVTMAYEEGCTALNTIPREVEVELNTGADTFNKNRTNATVTYTITNEGAEGNILRISEANLIGGYILEYTRPLEITLSELYDAIVAIVNTGEFNDRILLTTDGETLTIELIGIYAGRLGNLSVFGQDNTGDISGEFSNAGAATGGQDATVKITKDGSDIIFLQDTDEAVTMSGLQYQTNRFINSKMPTSFMQKTTGELKITKPVPLKNRFRCNVFVYGIKK